MDTKQESAHKVKSGEENSLATPAGVRTHNLLIMSPVLLPTNYPGSLVQYPSKNTIAKSSSLPTSYPGSKIRSKKDRQIDFICFNAKCKQCCIVGCNIHKM